MQGSEGAGTLPHMMKHAAAQWGALLSEPCTWLCSGECSVLKGSPSDAG